MDKAVVWSVKAKKDLKAIKIFYDNRNRSSTYSNKLLREFRKAAMLIRKYPEAAIIVDYEQVKGFIILDYILFYKVFDSHILILTVWDSRRNPESLSDLLNL